MNLKRIDSPLFLPQICKQRTASVYGGFLNCFPWRKINLENNGN